MTTRKELLKSALGIAAVGSLSLNHVLEAEAASPSPPEKGFILQMPENSVPPFQCGDIVRYGHGPDSYLQQFEVIEVHWDSIRVVRRW